MAANCTCADHLERAAGACIPVLALGRPGTGTPSAEPALRGADRSALRIGGDVFALFWTWRLAHQRWAQRSEARWESGERSLRRPPPARGRESVQTHGLQREGRDSGSACPRFRHRLRGSVAGGWHRQAQGEAQFIALAIRASSRPGSALAIRCTDLCTPANRDHSLTILDAGPSGRAPSRGDVLVERRCCLRWRDISGIT